MIQQSVRRNHEQWLSLNTYDFFSGLRDSVKEILVHLSEYLAIYSKVFRIYLRKVLVNMHLSVSLHFSRNRILTQLGKRAYDHFSRHLSLCSRKIK